jgi:hypothetical protein
MLPPHQRMFSLGNRSTPQLNVVMREKRRRLRVKITGRQSLLYPAQDSTYNCAGLTPFAYYDTCGS